MVTIDQPLRGGQGELTIFWRRFPLRTIVLDDGYRITGKLIESSCQPGVFDIVHATPSGGPSGNTHGWVKAARIMSADPAPPPAAVTENVTCLDRHVWSSAGAWDDGGFNPDRPFCPTCGGGALHTL